MVLFSHFPAVSFVHLHCLFLNVLLLADLPFGLVVLFYFFLHMQFGTVYLVNQTSSSEDDVEVMRAVKILRGTSSKKDEVRSSVG